MSSWGVSSAAEGSHRLPWELVASRSSVSCLWHAARGGPPSRGWPGPSSLRPGCRARPSGRRRGPGGPSPRAPRPRAGASPTAAPSPVILAPTSFRCRPQRRHQFGTHGRFIKVCTTRLTRPKVSRFMGPRSIGHIVGSVDTSFWR